MEASRTRGLAIGSWTILCIYLVFFGLGTLEFVRFTVSTAGILDQLGGTLPPLTRVAIMLVDMIRFSFLWIPLVLFALFLVYKEMKWQSKIKTLVVNNVAFVVTFIIGYTLRLAMMLPMFNIIETLSR
jgi:type II secretory pathway component PulF